MNMADATPAACYAHVNSRKKMGEIFAQIWKPRYGDGWILSSATAARRFWNPPKSSASICPRSWQPADGFSPNSYNAIPAGASAGFALEDDDNFDVDAATAKAIEILSRNPKGFFLMVEWDLPRRSPSDASTRPPNSIAWSKRPRSRWPAIRWCCLPPTTLSISGSSAEKRRRSPATGRSECCQEQHAHGGKAVGSCRHEPHGRRGPGGGAGTRRERVSGVMANTDLFGVMLSAFGWTPDPAGAPAVHSVTSGQ